MVGQRILLGCLLIVLLCLSTEGRKRKRASLRGKMMNRQSIMLSDDPLLSVTAIGPSTKIGQCSCKCCETPPAPYHAPPCMNDVIVAVDSSACFRDHHRRMTQFLEKLVSHINKEGGDAAFGVDKTRMAIMQFSSDIEHPLPLDDFNNYQDPSTSKRLKTEITERIRNLGFLGEGAFLNKALNATVREFLARRRPDEILSRRGAPRKVVIMLTNGKSHPDVSDDDIDYSIELLKKNNITVLPVAVTRACFGVSSPDWDEGLCPDVNVLKKLSKLSTYDDDDFLLMKSSVDTVVEEATDCKFQRPAPLKDYCNNCTCSCELPIGPEGEKGDRGIKGDSVKGEVGPKGGKGDKGEIGRTGPKGEFGQKGDKGEIGPIGPKGNVGVVGPKGDKGEIGEKGVIGPKGTKGDIGPKGDKGVKGEDGFKGNVGRKGETGDKGQKGQKGEEGLKGEVGPKGIKGTDGIGIKGTKGEIGRKGTDGGDGPKGMIGPKGPKGMIGLCGKPGPAGYKGAPGLPGFDGADGLDGPPGTQGPRGPEGIQGIKGERGSAGEDGVPGPLGPIGPPGPRGVQGATGERGFDGADSKVPGPRGPEGAQGQKGERGQSGRDGTDGRQGTPGKQGPRGFVGPKGEEGVLNIEELRPLISEIVRQLLPGECEPTDNGGSEPTPPPENGYSRCADSQADVAFLIDGSSSVGDEDFKLLRKFLYDFVASFEFIGPDGFRVSVIQYNESPRIELTFEDSIDQATVLNTIDNLRYLQGNTQTGYALDVAGTLFNEIRESGKRPGVVQVVVVITDGRSQDDVAEPAYALKEEGVKIFAVGVTDSSEYVELVEIASEPSDEHIYTVETYGKIDTIKESLLQKICKAVRGSYRAPDDEEVDDEEGSAGVGELSLDLLST